MKDHKWLVTLYNPHLPKNGDGEWESQAVFVTACTRRGAVHAAKSHAKYESHFAGWRLFPCEPNVQIVG